MNWINPFIDTIKNHWRNANLNSYIYTYFFNEMNVYFKNLTTKKNLWLDESTVECQQKF